MKVISVCAAKLYFSIDTWQCFKAGSFEYCTSNHACKCKTIN